MCVSVSSLQARSESYLMCQSAVSKLGLKATLCACQSAVSKLGLKAILCECQSTVSKLGLKATTQGDIFKPLEECARIKVMDELISFFRERKFSLPVTVCQAQSCLQTM